MATANHPLRIYTAAIGLVCAGSVVVTLQARHDADHARSTQAQAVASERARTAYWAQVAATAQADDEKVRAQFGGIAARYNALVAQKQADDRRYVRELKKAQQSANGSAVRYVGGGTSYQYTTVASSSSSGGTTAAPPVAPATKTS